jgi:glycosyltransferase involved in cell wall biosynthesis
MKKVLFIQPAYAHYREDLFSILSQRHSIIFLFERSEGPYPGKEIPNGIDYTFIDKRFKIGFIGLIYYLFKYDFDIIVSSVSNSNRTIISFIYAAIFRKKFILWILEWKKTVYRGDTLKKILKEFKYFIAKKIITKSHALVVGGTAARNYAHILGIKDMNIFTALQCSKDINNQGENFHDDKSANKKFTFLFLSRIISLKGLDILIKAFHLLRQKRDDIFLLIGGEGPSKEYCFNLTEFLTIPDVEFVGSLSHDKTKGIFEKADIFILPSYELDAHYEAWGLVVNEAMSMKLPVITTTGVGASYDMIKDGYNGFVVRENNVDELYRAMNNILKCDLIKMGNNSRKIFEEKNNYIKMANGFTDAIDYVANNRNPIIEVMNGNKNRQDI